MQTGQASIAVVFSLGKRLALIHAAAVERRSAGS